MLWVFFFVCDEIIISSSWMKHTKKNSAVYKFPNHESSRCHKDAVLKTITIPATTKDIGESLSSQLAKDRLEHRQCFLKLLSNVRFLARQALPLRGGGDESNSNYMQLLKLRGEDDSRAFQWIKKKTDKYTSGDMQNEMIKVMALQVLQEVASSIHSVSFVTLMVDETTDASNHEQVVHVVLQTYLL